MTDQISPDDLQCLHAAQEHARSAQAALRWQVAYLRSKYRIAATDGLDTASGQIMRRIAEPEPEPAAVNGSA